VGSSLFEYFNLQRSRMVMGIEIERKFTVKNRDWLSLNTQRVFIRQGYLSTDAERTVRIRIYDQQGKITIKSKNIAGVRAEYEYDIPFKDAVEMLDTLCFYPQIKKHRNIVPYGDHQWEIDEFIGLNQGLIVAEIELSHPEEDFVIPPWIDKDITLDHRYSNSQLCLNPYSNWGNDHS
jgi:adenylate cyclase